MTLEDLLKQINNLSQDQKQQIINALKHPVNIPNRYENGYICPHCGKTHIRKNGKKKEKQRYICMKCGKTFTEYNNTVFFSTKKPLNFWIEYIELMMTGLSLAKIALKLHISTVTSFNWRHKILKAIKKFQLDTVIGGIVEADETFLLESHKGKHTDEQLQFALRKTVISVKGMSDYCLLLKQIGEDDLFTLAESLHNTNFYCVKEITVNRYGHFDSSRIIFSHNLFNLPYKTLSIES